MSGPLTGIRIVEFEGIGPAPYAGMLLSDLGADVVRIARPSVDRGPLIESLGREVADRGRQLVKLDLKDPSDHERALTLVDRADALIEGLRPGVMERLRLGPEECHARNPRLVYCRVTGWGQTGPLARRAGHDINYIALSGALYAMGCPDRPPAPPLNLIGDYGGGGLFAAFGLLAALMHAERTGQGQVVDSAMLDGAASQMSMLYGLFASGHWSDQRGSNLLDGAAPFYRCYACSDGKFIAVGAIEPQFFAAMMEGFGLQGENWDQVDRSQWPAMSARIAEIVAREPRAHWDAVFADTDACVSPVLSMAEAAAHDHNVVRQTFRNGPVQPSPAPRLSKTPGDCAAPAESSYDVVAERWAR